MPIKTSSYNVHTPTKGSRFSREASPTARRRYKHLDSVILLAHNILVADLEIQVKMYVSVFHHVQEIFLHAPHHRCIRVSHCLTSFLPFLFLSSNEVKLVNKTYN